MSEGGKVTYERIYSADQNWLSENRKQMMASDQPKAVAAWDLYEMIQAFLQAPGYHVLFEVLLILWILRLLFIKSYKPKRTVLSDKEKEELLEEWQPEPLVPDVDEKDPNLQNMYNRVVDSKIGKNLIVNGKDCLNMGTFNFLSMVGRPEVEESARKAISHYGVGSCGPRGFYGTVDVHLELEEKLAKFLSTEEAIVYSYGFATIASAIPAYSKRNDVIFADEGVHFAIQKGIQASRSAVRYFKHNDMHDLERLLKQQAVEDKKNPKKAKATRRFLVVEGLYMKYGDICPLPELVELKWKYKVRIFMDETLSFGALGKTGKGVTEYYGIDIDELTLMSASLETSLGSVGGFCAGKAFVTDHQRLSGLGYCFSASTPPMLTVAAIKALEILSKNPGMVEKLQENSKYFHKKLNELSGVQIIGDDISPMLFIEVEESVDADTDRAFLQKIVQYTEDHGVAVTMASYLGDENILPPPRIRVCINCDLTKKKKVPTATLR